MDNDGSLKGLCYVFYRPNKIKCLDFMEKDILEDLQKRKIEKSPSSILDQAFGNPEKKNFESYFKLKSWCDAKDQMNVWRLGKIKKISGFENKEILILF